MRRRHEDPSRDPRDAEPVRDGGRLFPGPVPVLPAGGRGDDAELGGDRSPVPLRGGGRPEGESPPDLGFPRSIDPVKAYEFGRRWGWFRLDEVLVELYPSRPLVVGQAPCRWSSDLPPLWWESETGFRWSRLLGVGSFAAYVATRRVNLCEEYPGAAPGGLGDAIGDPSGQTSRVVEEHARKGLDVVLLGREVASFFGVDSGASTRAGISRWRGGLVYWLPHPSGVSRAWNDPDTGRFVRSMLGGLVREHGGLVSWRSAP